MTPLPRQQAAYALPLVVAKPIAPHPSAPCLPTTLSTELNAKRKTTNEDTP